MCANRHNSTPGHYENSASGGRLFRHGTRDRWRSGPHSGGVVHPRCSHRRLGGQRKHQACKGWRLASRTIPYRLTPSAETVSTDGVSVGHLSTLSDSRMPGSHALMSIEFSAFVYHSQQSEAIKCLGRRTRGLIRSDNRTTTERQDVTESPFTHGRRHNYVLNDPPRRTGLLVSKPHRFPCGCRLNRHRDALDPRNLPTQLFQSKMPQLQQREPSLTPRCAPPPIRLLRLSSCPLVSGCTQLSTPLIRAIYW